MKRALIVAILAGVGCRHSPRALHRIEVADTPEGRQCYSNAMSLYETCLSGELRRGLCAKMRYDALMACPGARNATGEPDPTVIQLPGYRPGG